MEKKHRKLSEEVDNDSSDASSSSSSSDTVLISKSVQKKIRQQQAKAQAAAAAAAASVKKDESADDVDDEEEEDDDDDEEDGDEDRGKKDRTKKQSTSSSRNKGEQICSVCEKKGDLYVCTGPCVSAFHLRCVHEKGDVARDQWVCPSCKKEEHECFHCKVKGPSNSGEPSNIEDNGVKPVRKCRALSCGKFYHLDCITKLPLARIAGTNFICPLHTCAACEKSGAKKESIRCMRCPVAYHSSCLPKSSGLCHLSSKCIVCPKHIHESKKPSSSKVKVELEEGEKDEEGEEEEDDDEDDEDDEEEEVIVVKKEPGGIASTTTDKASSSKSSKEAGDHSSSCHDHKSSASSSKKKSSKNDKKKKKKKKKKKSKKKDSKEKTEPSIISEEMDNSSVRQPANIKVEKSIISSTSNESYDVTMVETGGETSGCTKKKKRKREEENTDTIVETEQQKESSSSFEEKIKSPSATSSMQQETSSEKKPLDRIKSRLLVLKDDDNEGVDSPVVFPKKTDFKTSSPDAKKQKRIEIHEEEEERKEESTISHPVDKVSSSQVDQKKTKAIISSAESKDVQMKETTSSHEVQSDEKEEKTTASDGVEAEGNTVEAGETGEDDASLVQSRGSGGRAAAEAAKNKMTQASRGKKKKQKSKKTEVADDRKWVLCDRCKKWRTVPQEMDVDAFPEKWFCEMNTWNLAFASCEVAEEGAEVTNANNSNEENDAATASGEDGSGGEDTPNVTQGDSTSNTALDDEKAKKKQEKISKKRKLKLKLKLEKKFKHVDWVLCEHANCGKWRVVPAQMSGRLPSKWFCSLNTWQPELASCTASNPEEVELFLESFKKKPSGRPPKKQKLGHEQEDTDTPATTKSGKGSKTPTPTHAVASASSSHNTDQADSKRGEDDSAKGRTGRHGSKDEKATTPGGSASGSGTGNAGSFNTGASTGDTSGTTPGAPGVKKTVLEWAQCEKCNKWRKLPHHIKSSTLPDKWYCSMNHWDPSRASCSIPEEKDQEPLEASLPGAQTWFPGGGRGPGGSGGVKGKRGKLTYGELLYGSNGLLKKTYTEVSSTLSFEYEGKMYHRDDQYKNSSMYVSPSAFSPTREALEALDEDEFDSKRKENKKRESRHRHLMHGGDEEDEDFSGPELIADKEGWYTLPLATYSSEQALNQVSELILQKLDLKTKLRISELLSCIEALKQQSNDKYKDLVISLPLVANALNQLIRKGIIEKIVLYPMAPVTVSGSGTSSPPPKISLKVDITVAQQEQQTERQEKENQESVGYSSFTASAKKKKRKKLKESGASSSSFSGEVSNGGVVYYRRKPKRPLKACKLWKSYLESSAATTADDSGPEENQPKESSGNSSTTPSQVSQ